MLEESLAAGCDVVGGGDEAKCQREQLSNVHGTIYAQAQTRDTQPNIETEEKRAPY